MRNLWVGGKDVGGEEIPPEYTCTTKAWTELVIKPTLFIMQFPRATHEHEYALLTSTMNNMLPYVFAAHKHNYARYGFFCRSLTYLPNEVEQHFLHGEHILHHADGLSNGVPSYQFIETTWMKRGNCPSGVIGVTQNPQTVATLAHGQHRVVTLMMDLQMMTEEETLPNQTWCHGSWILVPYTVWMHWSNGSWHSTCRCLS